MAAITIDSPRWREGWGETTRHEPPRPALTLVGAGTRRPSEAVLRRRRVVVFVAALLLAGAVVAAMGLTRPAAAGSPPVGRATHVVEPGDTYWSIAAELDRPGDLRTAVDALVDANGARPLFPGDVIEVPR